MTKAQATSKMSSRRSELDSNAEIELVPDAASLIESMRDFGYSLETAVADIIDNSLTAAATRIEVLAAGEGPTFRLGILDNGKGMTHDELMSAMKPGSRSPLEARSKTDLGRFGLGLKTASFSQCRCLTVVTRKGGQTSIARWDLDVVQAQARWVVLLPRTADGIPWADRIESQGTLVLWERVDRLVSTDGTKASARRSQDLNEQLAALSEHLELVFHRFLSGEPGRKKIAMLLNGRPLVPHDPFFESHPATQFLPDETILVGGRSVKVRAVVLPHFSRVDRATWERYAGKGGYLQNQGFYLYRQRRLIVFGTWFGLMRKLPIQQLARVRLDIDNSWDDEWKVDIKKASAQLPPLVKERLREFLEKIDLSARRPFVTRGRTLADSNHHPMWLRIQLHGTISYRLNEAHPWLAAFMAGLSTDQRRDLSSLLEFAGASLPIDALFADLGGDAEKVTGGKLEASVLERALGPLTTALRAGGLGDNEIADVVHRSEPYKSDWERTEKILRRLLPTMEKS
jgi:hypothetical protein